MLEPAPRAVASPYSAYAWPAGRVTQLPARSVPVSVDLLGLSEERQTRRAFGMLTEQQLGELLWLACRNRSTWASEFGVDQESRVHPSAGAMHPIHVLVGHEGSAWQRYDPTGHSLVELPSTEASASSTRRSAADIIPLGSGTVLGLVAEPGKTQAKYENYESLVWRDAGVVLGYLSLMSEALGLAFSPLGLTGGHNVTEQLPGTHGLIPVGLAVVGTRLER